MTWGILTDQGKNETVGKLLLIRNVICVFKVRWRIANVYPLHWKKFQVFESLTFEILDFEFCKMHWLVEMVIKNIVVLNIDYNVYLCTVSWMQDCWNNLLICAFGNVEQNVCKSMLFLVMQINAVFLSLQLWLVCFTPALTAIWVNPTNSKENGLVWCGVWQFLWV